MLKFGHRGACGYAPENTLASFEKALELGVDGVEFDIRLSKDGIPMVVHDDALERDVPSPTLIAEHNAELLQERSGYAIPTLQEVFDFVDKRCQLCIELKSEDVYEATIDVIQHNITHKNWGYDQLSVCSFDHTQLQSVKNKDAAIRTSALLVAIPYNYAQIAADIGCWSINPNIHHCNQALVDDAHTRGLNVITWTVNEARHIDYAKKLGVDAIISDYPDRL